MSEVGDLLHIRIDTKAADQALAKLQKDLDRATMQGLRAAGRSVKQVAKRRAPVYSPKSLYDFDRRAVPGRLKNSIHSSKQLRRLGPNNYSLSVGPWGPVVQFYRAKVDDGRYMQAGYEDAKGRMESKFIASYTRVLEKTGRI